MHPNEYNACMKSIQYTIRGIAPDFDRRLRSRARESSGSFNAFLLQLLHLGMGESADKPFDNGLGAFAGTWVDDPETDRALEAQRGIDGDLWK
jgi:hypothetical protein